MPSTRLRIGACGAIVAMLMAAGPANAAPDAKAVADALVAAAVAAGGTASYGSAEASGEDVVVTDFKATERGQTLTVPALVVATPVPREPGGFNASRVTFDNVSSMSAEGRAMTWQTGLAEDVILLTPEEIKSRASVRPFRTVRVAGIQITVKEGVSPVTIDEVASEFGEVKTGEPRSFAMRAGPIAVKTDLLSTMPSYRRVIELLGYKDFVVNIASEGGYDDKSDTLTLSSFAIDTANVGKLTISGKFSGMSLGRIATKGDSVGTTAQAKLNNLQIHFANGGVVERVIDMQANSSGSSREEIVEQATAVVAVTFMFSGNAGFADKISSAVGAFLADPKTLTFTAAPASPVTLGQIFAAAIGARETLPDLLSVDVKANE